MQKGRAALGYLIIDSENVGSKGRSFLLTSNVVTSAK